MTIRPVYNKIVPFLLSCSGGQVILSSGMKLIFSQTLILKHSPKSMHPTIENIGYDTMTNVSLFVDTRTN